MKIKKVKVETLKPGMTLVYGLTYQGKKLFKSGTVLDDTKIKKIKALSGSGSYISITEGKLPEVFVDKNGKVDSKATFASFVMNMRSKKSDNEN